MKKYLIPIALLCMVLLVASCGKKPEVESEGRTDNGSTTTTQDNNDGTGIDDDQVKPIEVTDFVTIYFDFDKYNLRSDAIAGLKNNYDVMKSKSEVRVRIEGHCDERGTVEYNLALGEKRAQAAKDYLTSLGIASDRISIISYGKERPVALGSNEDAWAQNRRAEFVKQ